MKDLKDKIAFGKFHVMQLRARGLPTTRPSQYETELNHMKDLVVSLRRDVQNAVDERNQFYHAFRNLETAVAAKKAFG